MTLQAIELPTADDTSHSAPWPPPPTPAEIEQRAAEIRAGWTDEQRENRLRARCTGEHFDPRCEPMARAAMVAKLARVRVLTSNEP